MTGTRWENTPAGWKCDGCGHIHKGLISAKDDEAHQCSAVMLAKLTEILTEPAGIDDGNGMTYRADAP
jgi:hypothetical protein